MANFQDVLRDVHNPEKHALQVDGIEIENVVMSGLATVVNAAGSAYIGLVSIQGNVNLNAGINRIGFATVNQANQPALVAGTAKIGYVTAVNGTSTANIGSVSILGGGIGLNTGINNIGFSTVYIGGGLVEGRTSNPSGYALNVQIGPSINNKPRVSSMPYLYDIAEGNVAGHTSYAKLGYNGDVGATEEDIITQGGSYYWIPTATALEVLSTGAGAANDTIDGTGVQKVKITYLDADYSQQTQTLDMAGGTPVPLTDTTILRVNSIRATQVGTGGVAAGDIICRTVVGTNTVRQISAGFTRGRGLTYTVPLGKTLYITSVAVSSGYTTAGKVVRWIGRAQVDDTDPDTKISFFQPFFEIITQDSSFHREFEIPVHIPATADLKVSATSNGAGSFCNVALRGWLE